jgi:transcriptional regulator with XRE-family HTH domain
MGSASRRKPARLGEKLKTIRENFEYSFSQMAAALSDRDVKVLKTDVHKFENGEREPNLIILLKYARLGNVTIDFLADDKRD